MKSCFLALRLSKNLRFSQVLTHKNNTVLLFSSSIIQNLRFSQVLKYKINTVLLFGSSIVQNLYVFIGFETQKQYSLAFQLFDCPKPQVFIGFETQKQYSLAFWLFDCPKLQVFIRFETQNQYSQRFSQVLRHKSNTVKALNQSKPISFDFLLEFNSKSTKICSEPAEAYFLSFPIIIQQQINQNLL